LPKTKNADSALFVDLTGAHQTSVQVTQLKDRSSMKVEEAVHGSKQAYGSYNKETLSSQAKKRGPS